LDDGFGNFDEDGTKICIKRDEKIIEVDPFDMLFEE
jgi:hypothetical protein